MPQARSEERAESPGCRVAHEDVQLAEGLADEVHHRTHVVFLAHIGSDHQATLAQGVDSFGELHRCGLGRDVVEHDVCTRLSQPQSRRLCRCLGNCH